jgi:hypothetical protein
MTEIDCQRKDPTLCIMEETNQPWPADTRRENEGKAHINLLTIIDIKGIQLLIVSLNHLQDLNNKQTRIII